MRELTDKEKEMIESFRKMGMDEEMLETMKVSMTMPKKKKASKKTNPDGTKKRRGRKPKYPMMTQKCNVCSCVFDTNKRGRCVGKTYGSRGGSRCKGNMIRFDPILYPTAAQFGTRVAHDPTAAPFIIKVVE